MGDCELCGAMKVSTKQVKTGKTIVSACLRCIDKLNLLPKKEAPGLSLARSSNISKGSGSPRRNDLMRRDEKDLAEDFSSRITQARKQQQMTQQQLAKKMAETVNVIKSAEAGKRPTDSVIKKFERILNIELMVQHTPSETQRIINAPSRGMTLGDYLNELR